MAKLNRRETRYVSVLVVHIPDVMALIDMLRYDRCCPTSEDETQKIYRLLGERRGGKDASPLDPCDPPPSFCSGEYTCN